jgi:hypothetical protein
MVLKFTATNSTNDEALLMELRLVEIGLPHLHFNLSGRATGILFAFVGKVVLRVEPPGI